MKERHKRKERYSFIMVSHTDNQSRQFSVSATGLKLLAGVFLLICIAIGLMIYQLMTRGYREYRLQSQMKEHEQRIQLLEKEKAELISEKESLILENQKLQAAYEQEENGEENGSKDIVLPRLYPSDGVGDLKATFTEDEPYLTIGMHRGDNVVATGDGIVRLIDYDENYAHSIEIEHANGYISRYLCNKEVTILVSEGDMVKARDLLFAITANDTELDYQIMLNNEAVNPFQVMKLEG
ncbi:MAG: M23 family metallopeptidase [Lachnospiraceae bacterium]